MKNNYFFAVLLCLAGLFAASAQLNINNDTPANSVNGASGQFGVINVLENDSWNTNPISLSFFTLTPLSSTSPGIVITPNGWVTVSPGTAPGIYTLTYQVCQISNPTNCGIGTVTITICTLDPPVVTPQSCSDQAGNLTVTNLPATGIWTLTRQRNSETPTSITGTGTSHTYTGATPGSYRFSVSIDGCTSVYTNPVGYGYYDGFDAVMNGVYQDTNNDGIVSIGDTVIYQMALTNILPCQITDVTLVESSIAFPAFPIAVLNAGETVNVTGSYLITQADINNGTVYEWSGISGTVNGGTTYTKVFDDVPLGIPTGLRFIAFIDSNANGVQDNGEPNYTDGQLQYALNNGSPIYVASNTGEITIFETNPANTYDVSYSVYAACAGQLTIDVSSYTDISAVGSGFTTYYFPITVQDCQDIAVYVSPASNPRPDMTYSQYISYVNYGTQALASGTITFTAPPNTVVTAVSEPGATITATGFTYNFTNLAPGDYNNVLVTMAVANVPVVNLGDILTSSASVTIPSGDANPANNSAAYDALVTNSYDPNDITEKHGPRILHSSFDTGTELQYTVRFENTGNADAIDIDILTVLDDKLDPNSVRVIASSHNFQVERAETVMATHFEGINLPPSVTGTETGKGFVTYAVKVKPGIAVGDIIFADAFIYFDSNPEIATNMWQTEFVNSLATGEVSVADVTVSPNPASGSLNIRAAATIENIRLTDVTGKTVLQQAANGNHVVVDISALSKGIYFLTASHADGATMTTKMIKE